MPEPLEASVPAELPLARERAAIVALSLLAFALNLNTLVIGALLPFLPVELVAPGEEGDLIKWAALGSAVAALAAGPLADRWGRRRLLLIGLVAFLLASVLCALAESLAVLLLARVLSGAAVGIGYACASALAAAIVPYRRRGAALGVFTAGMYLALPLGLPLAWWLGRLGMWQAIFWVQTAIAAVGLWLGARTVPDVAVEPVGGDPRAVLTRPPVLAALAAVMLNVGSFFTVVQLAPRWLDQPHLIPADRQGYVWVFLGLGAAIGSYAFGRLSDRVGKHRFVLLTSLLLVPCFAVLPHVTTLAQLAPLGIALAVISPARTGPLQALTSALVPRSQLGVLMGLRAFAMQFGIFLFAELVPANGPGGFTTVLYAAAACQVASYVAIRIGVRGMRE